MEIDLGKGLVAVIDDEDAALVAGFTWYAMKAPQKALKYYAAGWKLMPPGRFFVHLHRLILDARPDQLVDHIDGDTLNCRRSNLRIVTRQQNIWNRAPNASAKSSRYKGVCFDRKHKLFVVRITFNGKRRHIGWFKDEVAAARAYNAKAKELFGEFAYLNDVPEILDGGPGKC